MRTMVPLPPLSSIVAMTTRRRDVIPMTLRQANEAELTGKERAVSWKEEIIIIKKEVNQTAFIERSQVQGGALVHIMMLLEIDKNKEILS